MTTPIIQRWHPDDSGFEAGEELAHQLQTAGCRTLIFRARMFAHYSQHDEINRLLNDHNAVRSCLARNLNEQLGVPSMAQQPHIARLPASIQHEGYTPPDWNWEDLADLDSELIRQYGSYWLPDWNAETAITHMFQMTPSCAGLVATWHGDIIMDSAGMMHEHLLENAEWLARAIRLAPRDMYPRPDILLSVGYAMWQYRLAAELLGRTTLLNALSGHTHCGAVALVLPDGVNMAEAHMHERLKDLGLELDTIASDPTTEHPTSQIYHHYRNQLFASGGLAELHQLPFDEAGLKADVLANLCASMDMYAYDDQVPSWANTLLGSHAASIDGLWDEVTSTMHSWSERIEELAMEEPHIDDIRTMREQAHRAIVGLIAPWIGAPTPI